MYNELYEKLNINWDERKHLSINGQLAYYIVDNYGNIIDEFGNITTKEKTKPRVKYIASDELDYYMQRFATQEKIKKYELEKLGYVEYIDFKEKLRKERSIRNTTTRMKPINYAGESYRNEKNSVLDF